MTEYSIWIGSYNALMDTAAKVKLGHERYVPEAAKYMDRKGPAITAGFTPENGVYGFMVQRAGIEGRTAVIKVRDGMVHRAEWWHKYVGVTSYEALVQALLAAENDPSIDSVALDLDTPGGMVAGIDSVTDVIGRMTKPVVGYTGGIMASGGYWIGSATKLLVASKQATVGSVGVIVIRQDLTKMLEDMGVKMEVYRVGDNKARMNPFEDMRDEDKAYLMSDLKEAYGNFLDQIAEGRSGKVSRSGLEELTEHGRTFSGKTAVEKNLVDYNASWLDLLAQMDSKLNNNGQEQMVL